MNRHIALVAATIAGLLSITAQATPAAPQKVASAQYLMGTWSCEHNVGSFAGRYKTTYTTVQGNLWLRQTYEFLATPTQPAKYAEALMGYDERRQAWVRFLVLSTGEYFAMRMTETSAGGWSWKYVSFFPTQKPESPNSDATLTKKSDTEYAIDGPSYPENGTGPIVTEHHICKKL